jgi:uncharacterized membrane protein YoaK (UPF0700 family)
MNAFVAEIRQMLVPDPAGRHGPLPPLLLAMTVVTGLVDAFSYLLLGHVFVANMTGNVVLLGFALAGAPGFSVTASLTALAAFGCGAMAGGRLVSRLGANRGRLLSAAAAAQTVLLAASVALAAVTTTPVSAGYRYTLIVLLGVAMGTQNAATRALAVPDLTTTVLTLTLTGLAADSAAAGGKGARAGRRLLSVAAMLAGALAGALLVVHRQTAWPLAIALAAVIAVAAVARRTAASGAGWTRPAG